MSDDVEKSIWINAQRSAVFEYFTDAEAMKSWCGLSAELDPRPGGIYKLDMGVAGVIVGRFIDVTAPALIVYEVDPPKGFDIAPSQVRIELSEEAGGTRVVVTHSGLPAPFQAVALRGWDHHLARLAVAVSGGQPGADSLCTKPMEEMMDA